MAKINEEDRPTCSCGSDMTKIHVERKHPMFNCNRLNGFYNANVAIWDRLEESEETEVKSKQELIEKWELAIESAEFYGKGEEKELISYMKEFVSDLNQLDEPEVLSQEFIDKYSVTRFHGFNPGLSKYIPVEKLQNLLVPKQEEVDRAYKAGYETGKEHATRDDEPETVASVMADFFGAVARFKEVLAMEVEEMENDDD